VTAPAATYPLQRDDAEHRRLSVQAAFWASDAAALFDEAGVATGDHVADLGCGTLHVANDLARRVGGRGRVYALDSDRRLIDAAEAVARPAQLQPVHGDAFALPWPDGALDAVHARFVASPCGHVDALVAEMLRVLRPGGVVMLQEPIADSWDVPARPAWQRLRELIRAGFARRGGDFDVGRTLSARLLRAGCADVRERRVMHTIRTGHPYAALPLAFCDALAATWRTERLADEAEFLALREDVRRALGHPDGRVTTFTLVQAWASKR
jgi:SAM-dependent methyltransferase